MRKGKRDLFELGGELRSHYKNIRFEEKERRKEREKYWFSFLFIHPPPPQLLSSNLTQQQLHFRSASHPNPLMSSPSLLLGLFPPGTGPSFIPSPTSSPPSPLSSLLWGGEEKEKEEEEEEERGALPFFFQPVPVFSEGREGDDVMFGYLNCRRLEILNRKLRGL